MAPIANGSVGPARNTMRSPPYSVSPTSWPATTQGWDVPAFTSQPVAMTARKVARTASVGIHKATVNAMKTVLASGRGKAIAARGCGRKVNASSTGDRNVQLQDERIQVGRPWTGGLRSRTDPLRDKHAYASTRAFVASTSARSFITSPAWPRTHFHSNGVRLHRVQQPPPQIHVRHRVTRGGAPVLAHPAGVPARDAVADVLAVGVQHHAARAASASPARRRRRSAPCGCWSWSGSCPGQLALGSRGSAGWRPSRPGPGWACSRHRSRSPPVSGGSESVGMFVIRGLKVEAEPA